MTFLPDLYFRVLKGLLTLCLFGWLCGCVTESLEKPTAEQPADKTQEPVVVQGDTQKDKEAQKQKALSDYTFLATGYLKEGKRDQALRALNKGMEIDDDSPALLNVLAVFYSTDGEVALAEKQYKNAISADSTYTASYLNYGVFLYMQERYDDALKMLEKATEDPLYAERELAFLNYGLALKKVGRDAEAEQSFKRSIANNPRNPRALLEMVQIEFDRGNFAQSRAYYEQLIKLSRQTPRSLWLGIRLMRVYGESDRLASYALFLKNEYPASKEYLEYKAWSESR